QVEYGLRVAEVVHAGAGKAGMAKTIVSLSLVGIAEHVVRFGGLLEALGGLFVADISVRMIFHGQLAISTLDVLVACFLRHAEDFVVVALAGHAALPLLV